MQRMKDAEPVALVPFGVLESKIIFGNIRNMILRKCL